MNRRFLGACIAAVVLLVTGLTTGTRIYFLMAILIGVVCLLSLLSVLAVLFSLRVNVREGQVRIKRGEGVNAVVQISHMGILPVAGITLNVGLNQDSDQEVSANLPPFSARTFQCRIQCRHRGMYTLGVRSATVRDLFSLFECTRKLKNTQAMRISVLPKAVNAECMPIESSDMGLEMHSLGSEDNASPSGIRAWQDGDSLKKVHWKLSMRRREVLVRTYEETARPDTLVLPNLSAIQLNRDTRLNLEDAICEQALGAVQAQLKSGFPVRMPLTGTRPSETAGQSVADLAAFAEALMRTDFDCPYSYEKVLMLMQSRIARTGGAILVTATLNERCADMAIRMQRMGVKTRVVLVDTNAPENTLEMLETLKMAGVQVVKS